MIYVITSKKKKKFITSKNYLEIAEFIKVNQDAKIWTLDYTAKIRILSKRKFLKDFLDATKDNLEFFALCEIMLPIYNNYITFISFMGLLKEFNQFKKDI